MMPIHLILSRFSELPQAAVRALSIMAVAFIYFGTAQAGLWLASLPGDVTPFWPPSGFALAALLLGGYWLGGGIFLGSLFVELYTHEITLESVLMGSSMASGNTLEALLAAAIIRHYVPKITHLLKRIRNVLVLLFAACSTPVISATFGVGSLYVAGVIPAALLQEVWVTWWKSAVTGILIFTPFLLVWQTRPNLEIFTPRRLPETIAFAGTTLFISWSAFMDNYPIEYMYLPLLIWAIFRLGQHPAVLLMVGISMLAAYSTAHGAGPFVQDELNNALVLLQSFMGVIAMTTLFLSAAIIERQHAHQALQTYNIRLERKVAERTAELSQANTAIQHLNEQLKAENMRMGAELDIARQLQTMVLPNQSELQSLQDLDIAVFMEPADEVGGDYYDVLAQDGRVRVSIGDVTGHGLASGVLMLMVQTAVRTLVTHNVTDPKAFFSALNYTLYKNIQRMNTDKNLTFAILDYQEGCLQISGQHEEILLVQQNGEIKRLDTFDLGFILGMVPDISEYINQQEISLQPGAGIVLYTDGIVEAFDSKKEMYGVTRLCQIISQNWQSTAEVIKDEVINDVKRHIGAQQTYDDITLLVMKRRLAEAV